MSYFGAAACPNHYRMDILRTTSFETIMAGWYLEEFEAISHKHLLNHFLQQIAPRLISRDLSLSHSAEYYKGIAFIAYWRKQSRY